MWIRRRRRYQAIEPDEILIDAQNLPGYDAVRLEGKIERPIESAAYRNFFAVSGIIGLVFLLQLGKLQVVESASLKERAEANRLAETLIIAERGIISDRFGEPLALNTPLPEEGFAARAYPLGEAASHVVGYVSYPKKDQNGFWFQTEVVGTFGVESLYNTHLAGENGVEIKETTATGEVVSGSVVRAPRHGVDVALSLDAKLQQKLYDLIAERSESSGFVGGSGVVMDVQTGELLALASYPSFDPTLLAEGGDPETVNAYFSNTRAPFLDRAISGLYAPGSVVKPFVALAALEEGIIDPEKEIESTGSISIPNPYDPSKSTIFRDWKAHGWTDMREAIAVSSDVYFYAVGGGYRDQPGLGISAIDEWMRRFGFGEQTGIALENEASGVVPNPSWKAETFEGEQWFLGNTYHTSIGQYGFQTTVIQLARAVAALGNGGALVAPTIERDASPARIPLKVSEEHLAIVREGMRLAVTDGTAAALNIPQVSVAAKTGTAEVGARKEFINSLIVGFFPAEQPRYSFAVVMERGKAGTTTGAPLVMRELLSWMVSERPEMLDAR